MLYVGSSAVGGNVGFHVVRIRIYSCSVRVSVVFGDCVCYCGVAVFVCW